MIDLPLHVSDVGRGSYDVRLVHFADGRRRRGGGGIRNADRPTKF